MPRRELLTPTERLQLLAFPEDTGRADSRTHAEQATISLSCDNAVGITIGSVLPF